MAGFDLPDSSPLVDDSGRASRAWASWFSRAHSIVTAAQQSGTTANRPTKVLWIGRRYFDTSYGKPVYVRSVNPAVWVDGAGTVCP